MRMTEANHPLKLHLHLIWPKNKYIPIFIIYLSLLFQLSVANSENFKEIKAWEVLKFCKKKESYQFLSLGAKSRSCLRYAKFVHCTKIL